MITIEWDNDRGVIIMKIGDNVELTFEFENFEELDKFLDEITDARNELANKMED